MAQQLASGFLVPERVVWDTCDIKHFPSEKFLNAQTIATIVAFSLNQLRCERAQAALQAEADARQAALQAEADARQAALQAEADARQAALQAALQAEADARQAALQAELQADADARQAALQAKADKDFRKKTSSISPNVVLPLHWIVHQDGWADSLDVSADCKERIRDLFSWCKSFAAAFFGGRENLFKWFVQEGFLGWHGRHDSKAAGAAATWAVFEKELEYLYDEEDWDPIQLQGSKLVDNGNGVEQVVLNSNDHKMKPNSSRRGIKEQQLAEQTIALLVKIPICTTPSKSGQASGHAASGCGADDQPSVEVAGAAFEQQLNIPSIRPQLNGRCVISSQLTSIPIQTFAFTVPRIHFLLTCSEAWSMGGASGFNAGVQLTGVHGSGKTTTLSALSSALAIGSQVDMWFVPKARDLAAPGSTAFADIFTMSTGEMTAVVHTDDSSTIPDKDGEGEESALQNWWGKVRACEHKWELNEATMRLLNSSGPQRFVVILDEVNDLLRHARVTDSSATAKTIIDFLKWREETRAGVLRIQSASPDGPREEFNENGRPMFFELRPPRASHMAAIMSAAASRFAPEVHVPTQETLDVARMFNVCLHFAGNMRYLTRLLVSASRIEHSNTADLLLHIERLGERYFNEYSEFLGKRIVKCLSCQTSDESEARTFGLRIPSQLRLSGRDVSVWFQYALCNASLVVRKDPTQLDSVAFLFKAVGYAAQAKALAECISSKIALQGNQELFLQAIFSLNDSVGDIFEEQIGLRLSAKRLCKYVIPLSGLPSAKKVLPTQQGFSQLIQSKSSVGIAANFTPLRGVVWPEEGAELHCSYSLFACLKPHLVSQSILSAVKGCMENGGVLIRTARTGPFCDFVLYRRCEGIKRQLIFFETTVSTCADHATKKKVPQGGQKRSRSRRTSANDPTTYQRCPPVLRDLFCLINKPMYTLTQEEGDLVFQTATSETARGVLSVGNAWLAALGSKARFASYGPDQAGNWHAELVQNSEDEMWDVRVVFVSARSLQEQAQSAALDKLCCDFAYCVLKEQLDVRNTKAASNQSSPVK